MSKMPAFARSAKRVVSKVRLKPSVCGSAEAGFEVGDGDADVGHAAGGLGLEGILRSHDRAASEKEEQGREPTKLGVPIGGRSFVTKHSLLC